MNTETGILEVANVTCDDAKASLAAAEKAAKSAEDSAASAHSALLAALNASKDLGKRNEPPATQAELAAAEKRQTDAYGADEKARNAATDAVDALTAAQNAKESACATGPTYLPNWPAPGPNRPTIAGPAPDVD